ncbi:MAG: single-stranded DNA-binding protein [Hydrogenoanaerobacterium sp.]
MNKVFLLGRLVADPELRQTQSNISVASFRVAVNRPYTKGAERTADFIDCVAWRNSADFLCKCFTKGKPILLEGRLQIRSYEDKQGQKRTAAEVVCDNISFVEGSSKADGASGNYTPPAQASSPAPATESGAAYASGAASDFQEVEGYDDLPF